MNMIGENGKAEQINPDAGGKLLKLTYGPRSAKLKILPRNRIVFQQETLPDHPVHDMHDRGFVRTKSTSSVDDLGIV